MRSRTILLALLILLTLGAQSAAPVSAYKAASEVSDDVHDAITEEAVAVLSADGYGEIAQEMYMYKSWIEAGSYDADTKNMELGTYDPVFPSSNHFHEASTHMGFKSVLQYMSAADVAQRYYDRACVRYMAHLRSDAYRDLGIALHLLQDLTVPHHSRLASTLSHVWYENDIPKDSPFIVNVNSGGIYSFASLAGHYNDDTMWGWADRAAHRSYDLYQYVDWLDLPPNDYEFAQSILLPFAARLSAGVMKMFYDRLQGPLEYCRSGVITPPATTFICWTLGLSEGPYTVVLMGNEPDAQFDLYVRWGAVPTTTVYDGASTSDDSLEFLTVYSWGLQLFCMVKTSSGGGSFTLAIIHGFPISTAEGGGSLSRPGSAQHHSLSIGSSAFRQGWVFLAGPDSSNFDALLRWGSPPVIMSGNIVTVDAGSYNSNSIEMCTFRSSLTTLYGTAFLRTGSGSYRILMMII